MSSQGFKLSISNIGWEKEKDQEILEMIKRHGYQGLEIAPTRVFHTEPYEKKIEAMEWSKLIKKEYGLEVSSMQSIWFGRKEKLFGTEDERALLLEYTKKAIDFAQVIGCKNLVFGCPKNRVKPEEEKEETAISFFRVLGEYAVKKGTVIGIEANPSIYNTNYINDTVSAFSLIEQVNSKGIRLNLDLGTMIYNNEPMELLRDKIEFINHVHISEPWLKPIEQREIHLELRDLLRKEGYSGYVSIEMGKVENVDLLIDKICYVAKIFK